jgi:OOP family OmpA-OmpF porin
MRNLIIVLLTLLAVALVGIFCGNRLHAPAIQEDISNRVKSSLLANNLDWVGTQVDGRDITLTGQAPTAALKAQAEQVAKVEGYHALSNQITIAAPIAIEDTGTEPPASNAYSMMISVDAPGNILLDGTVPDAKMHKKIVSMVKKKYGPDRITDQLQEVPGDTPKGWLKAIDVSIENLHFMESGSATLTDTKLTLTGQSGSTDVFKQVQRQVIEGLPKGYDPMFEFSMPDHLLTTGKGEKKPKQPPSEQKLMQDSAAFCKKQFKQILAQRYIHFQTSKETLKPGGYALLKRLAAVAKRCPRFIIHIHGHTDSDGNEASNLKLSQKRAQTVADYLIAQGVKPDNVTATGHGESKPVVSNATPKGRSLNRRIEITAEAIEVNNQ